MSSAVIPGLLGAGPVPSVSQEISTPDVGSQADGSGAAMGEGRGATELAALEVSETGVVDRDQIEDLRGMFGAEAFEKLLAKFSDDLRRRLETIDADASRANVASNAHAMISSAGSLGFKAFSDLCRAIERIAEGDSDMAPSIVAFTTGADHVLRTIASITGSNEP